MGEKLMYTGYILSLMCLFAVKVRGNYIMLPMVADTAETGHYMSLYNFNPSSFLKNVKFVPRKRSQEVRKKMTNGIVGLTRPRFGKRSTHVETEMPADLINPVARSITGKWGTGPRFRKRSLHGPSHFLKFLQNDQELPPNMILVSTSPFLTQDEIIKTVSENEEPNKIEEEDVLRGSNTINENNSFTIINDE